MGNMYERILTLCASKGIKPGKVCADTGLSRGLMSDLKMGRTKQLSAKTVKIIAEYFGVSTDYLISETGYGDGLASGAGFGDGTGYGGPILESETAYDRTNELCSLFNKVFIDVCLDAGLTNQCIQAWKEGTLPSEAALKKIATQFLVPVDFLLCQENNKTPTGSGERSVSDDDIKFALFGGDGEITDAMYEEVRRFAAFVKQREADKKKE